MELIRRKAFLLKGKDTPIGDNGTILWHMMPYFFQADGKAPAFLCNLVYRMTAGRQGQIWPIPEKPAEQPLPVLLGKRQLAETPDRLMDRAFQEKFLPSFPAAAFSSIPPTGNPATFFGQVKETGEEFLFRIYDRDYQYLLKRLRTVKRENCMENISDSSTLKTIL